MLVITYLITGIEYILYFLVLDFSIKIFLNRDYSLISTLSLRTRKLLNIEEVLTDGGAKKLAAIFGLFFVSLLALTYFFGSSALSFIIASIFLLCSLLDVIFNYCLGCKIYYIIKKIYPSFMD